MNQDCSTAEKNKQPVISMKNVSYTYMKGTPFEHNALKNINLEIFPGESVGIIGPTGSGKTTLSQHFNGLLRADSGTVTVDGVDIPLRGGGNKLAPIRFAVGLLFQFPEQQLFEVTVFNDVAFGPRNMKLSEEEVTKRVNKSLELVKLSPKKYASRSPFALSGGEKRRAALAGVLAMEPKCLVLDEPTAGLDPIGTASLLDLLKNLKQELNITTIIISHRFEELAQITDRLIVMSQGQKVGDSTTADILYNKELLQKHQLEMPALCQLFSYLKEKGMEFDKLPLTVNEAGEVLEKVLI